MAYRIPLQHGRHRGHVTGWSKLMHIAPSLPLLLRSPAVTMGPWTVEVVTFSCLLITVGGVCLVWTAVKPQYGSFLLGGALVALGACWLGVMCALRRNQEESRAASAAAAAAASSTSAVTSAATDDEETTTMIPVVEGSGLSVPPVYTDAAAFFRPPAGADRRRRDVVGNMADFTSLSPLRHDTDDDVRDSPDGAEDNVDSRDFR